MTFGARFTGSTFVPNPREPETGRLIQELLEDLIRRDLLLNKQSQWDWPALDRTSRVLKYGEYARVRSDSGDIVMGLPTAVGKQGERISMKFLGGSGTCSLRTTGSELVDYLYDEIVFTTGDYYVFYSDGTQWLLS